jgi:hypothetical protein
MSANAHSILRIPLLLLTVVNMVLLSMRLQPWQDIFSLPGNGTTGLDPAITLLGYFGLIFWLTGKEGSTLVQAQNTVSLLGVLGGAFLAAAVTLAGRPMIADPTESTRVQIGLLCVAGIVWGFGGILAARAPKSSVGFSIVAGAWCAMVSCLIACFTVLSQIYIFGPPPETQDLWKQFQEIGIGDQATVVLVHTLNAATGFLLIGPIAGSVVGLIFAFFGQRRSAEAAH